MVTKYGYANVKADNEEEVLALVEDMNDKDFDWSGFGDAEVVEEVNNE